MHHLRSGRADAGLPVALGRVEGPPLGTTIDVVRLDDQAAVAADDLGAVPLGPEFAPTLRADGRDVFLAGLGFRRSGSGVGVAHDGNGTVGP